MVSLKTLFLFATTALAAATPKPVEATPAQVAGFKALYSNLQGLDYSIKQLSATIKLYRSGVTEAAPIFVGVQNVHAANRKAFNGACEIPVLNITQSEWIVKYVTDPIAIDIPEGLKDLKAKKAPLVAAGLKAKVEASLNLLLGDHESLSVEIAKKLAPITLIGASAPTTKIDFSIREAIAYFIL